MSQQGGSVENPPHTDGVSLLYNQPQQNEQYIQQIGCHALQGTNDQHQQQQQRYLSEHSICENTSVTTIDNVNGHGAFFQGSGLGSALHMDQTQVNNTQQTVIDMQMAQHVNQNCSQNQQSNTAIHNPIHNGELMTMIKTMNNTVMSVSSRLSAMENTLGKLVKIECDLSKVRADITNIKLDNTEFNQRLIDVEIFCQNNSDSFDDFNKKNEKFSTQLSDLKTNNFLEISELKDENKFLKSQLSDLQSNYHGLKEEFLELKTRSMQENLIFFGIPEVNEQSEPFSSGQANRQENAEQTLRQFMSNELSLGSPDAVANIAFDRVHRLGARRRYSDKPRPIVAKFERFTDRETIRKAGMVLNNRPNSTYRVREQFPKEIEDRRKVLYSAMYRLKSNPQNRISLVRDKLYVNGQLYIPENDPEFRPPPQRTSYSKPNRQTTSFYQRWPEPQASPALEDRFSARATTRQTPRRQDLQPIPTHNKYSCLSDTSHETASGYIPERLPGQKHKTLSPLSEEGSPKKQKDNNLPRSKSRDRDNTPRKQITDNSAGKDTESRSNTNNVETMDTNVNRTETTRTDIDE